MQTKRRENYQVYPALCKDTVSYAKHTGIIPHLRKSANPYCLLEFTHFLASAGPPLAKAAEFNSDQQGSRYRSAELHLLRTLHSCLAERRMSALSWRRPPPDLLWRAGIGCHVF